MSGEQRRRALQGHAYWRPHPMSMRDRARSTCAYEYRSQLINQGGGRVFENGREGWKTKRGGKF